VAYGLRYFLICPEHFIVKVPLTAAGLIATRRLRDYGVPINFTLGFSARQNFLAANLARPNWTNVFLGRLNAYIKDNGLGDGVDVGEKATLASQRAMREVSATRKQPTWQIAASMRGASNVADLAGVDVFTMPVKVAAAAKTELKPSFTDNVANDPAATVADGARGETIWGISQADRTFAASVRENVPLSGAELQERAQAAGVGDLFPVLSAEDRAHIAAAVTVAASIRIESNSDAASTPKRGPAEPSALCARLTANANASSSTSS
jgi:transaldolase